MKKAPDFIKQTKDILAKRAGQKCSFPGCDTSTSGPHSTKNEAYNIGEASHIQGARPGAARYNELMTDEERSDITNGIWLCRTHAKLVDSDEKKYPKETLLRWKEEHEKKVSELNVNSKILPITIVAGTHIARGNGIVTGIKTSSPTFFKPGTKSIAEGNGVVTATQIGP